MNKYIIPVIFLVLFSYAASSEIATNTFVINSYPSIEAFELYSLYRSYHDKISENDFFICKNQNSRAIYFELNITDYNSIQQILDHGNSTYAFNTENMSRNVSYRNASMVFSEELAAMYFQGFSMQKNDTPGSYSLISKIFDGYYETIGLRNYSFEIKNCSSFVNDSIRVIEHEVNFVNASSINTTIELYSDFNTTGSLHLYLHKQFNKNYSMDLAQMSGFLNITASRSIGDVITLSEIHLHYSDDDITTLDIDEKSLKLYRWNRTLWEPVDNGGIDSYLNYVYGIEENLGEYAIFGIPRSSDKCIDEWRCNEWNECTKKDTQSRKCYKTNSCRSRKNKPITIKDCVYRGGNYKPPKDTEVPEIIQIEEAKKETVVIEDNGREILFDINVEMLDGDVLNSDDMLLKIGLLNFGLPGLVNVNLTYDIFSDDDLVFHITEKVPVETQVEFLKTLNISSLSDGRYRLELNLEYKGQLEPAKAEKDFIIRREQGLNVYTILIAILAVILLLLIFDKETRKKISFFFKKK